MNKNQIKLFLNGIGPGAKFCLYFSLSVIAFSAYKTADTLIFIARADVAEGRIVSFEKWGYFFLANGGDIGDMVLPVVTFNIPDGVTTKMFRVRNFERNDLGRVVRVYYNPSNPTDSKLDLFSDLWEIPSLIFGAGFIGLFLVYFWWIQFDSPIL